MRDGRRRPGSGPLCARFRCGAPTWVTGPTQPFEVSATCRTVVFPKPAVCIEVPHRRHLGSPPTNSNRHRRPPL